jgi:O-antigen ligase
MATSRVVSSSRPDKRAAVVARNAGFSRARLARACDYALVALFGFFAVALPLSGKATQHVYRAFVLLWLAKFGIERREPRSQPLVWPMFIFLCLSGISTALSPTPIYSWDRMKIVALMIIAVVVGDSIRKLRHLQVIVATLLVATALSAGVTGWQYVMGYGVEAAASENSALADAGLHPGDVIQSIDHRTVHSPEALRAKVAALPPDAIVDLAIVRGALMEHLVLRVNRPAIAKLAAAPLRRAHPTRAQGYFKHWDIYAEVMAQLGLLAWGLLLTRWRKGGKLRWLLAAVFLLALVTVAATQTRSALGAMLLGCFLIVMLVGNRRERAVGIGVLIVIFAVGTVWIHHTRGLAWVDGRDPGSAYRVLMWEDALRLIPQHPWFGLGMEGVRQYWREWGIRAWQIYGFHWHFHSTYLQIAVERGLPALAAWLWLIGAYLVFLWRLLVRVRHAAGWFSQGLALGALGGTVAFLVAGTVQYNLGEEQISAVLWFVMGLSVALNSIVHQRAKLDLVPPVHATRQGGSSVSRAA